MIKKSKLRISNSIPRMRKLAILFAASEPLDIETIEKRLQTNIDVKNFRKIKTDYENEELI